MTEWCKHCTHDPRVAGSNPSSEVATISPLLGPEMMDSVYSPSDEVKKSAML